ASAVASTAAPRSAPVTVASAPVNSTVVCAMRLLMASAAMPGVIPPTATPATVVPGAIRISDAPTAASATTPTPTPIHRPKWRFFGAGSAGAHSKDCEPLLGGSAIVSAAVATALVSDPEIRSVMDSPPNKVQ